MRLKQTFFFYMNPEVEIGLTTLCCDAWEHANGRRRDDKNIYLEEYMLTTGTRWPLGDL